MIHGKWLIESGLQRTGLEAVSRVLTTQWLNLQVVWQRTRDGKRNAVGAYPGATQELSTWALRKCFR